MDRRTFLSAAGALVASGGASETAQAEGYRRCEQLHDKLTPERIDKWTQELKPPYRVYPVKLETQPVPAIGDDCCHDLASGHTPCVTQGVAPEYFWTFPDERPECSKKRNTASGPLKHPRPQHVYRANAADGSPEPLHFLELSTRDIIAEVIPGWLTRILCYGHNGNYSTPGPTIEGWLGRPMVVRLRNEINPRLMLDVSMHNHGGHIPAHSDGHPNFMVEPESKDPSHPHQMGIRDYYYPNPVPLKVTSTVKSPDSWFPEIVWEPAAGDNPDHWDMAEVQSTMWYHDHAEDITAHNALMGLAGYFFLRDEVEKKLVDQGVLPPLEREIPLVFKDICLCPITQHDRMDEEMRSRIHELNESRGPDEPRIQGEARIHFDPFDHNGTLGNVQLVNGQAYPFRKVTGESYWLRMLNASLARFYNIEFWVIHPTKAKPPLRMKFLRFGKDSWLFDHAMPQNSVFIGMATRADVYLDFADLAAPAFADYRNTDDTYHVMVVSTLNQRDGRGPGHGDNEQTVNDFPRGMADEIRDDRAAPLYLMRFVVEGIPKNSSYEAPDPPQSIQRTGLTKDVTLRCHHKIETPKSGEIVVREFNFERGRGAWQINKKFYDACIANAVPQLWSTELWILRNRSGGWWHPIHIHVESHQQIFVRARNHRGQRIAKVRPGYDPKQFDRLLSDPETGDLLDLEAEVNAWEESFRHQSGLALPPDDHSDWWHDSRLNSFDDTVWNLDIKHDTTILGPNTEVHVLMRFRTFEGPFVFHCHNLDHEDMRMMFQMDPRAGLCRADESLKVRPDYWYFNDPHGAKHCCESSKGGHA